MVRPLAHQLEHVAELVLQQRRIKAELHEQEHLIAALHDATVLSEPHVVTMTTLETMIALAAMFLMFVTMASITYQVWKCDAQKTGRHWRRIWMGLAHPPQQA